MKRRNAKICVLGDFCVGKTSTVDRYVHNQFSDQYQTTVGVKIDTKEVLVDDQQIKLIFWDIAGTDDVSSLRRAHLKGATGYMLLADGTRSSSVDSALRVHRDIRQAYGELPFVALLNKHDLISSWQFGDVEQQKSEQAGISWIKTSAKRGESIEHAIEQLAAAIQQQ